MNFILEKPIFIEESFVIPLFDPEFEKQLLNVSDHLAADVAMIYHTFPEQLAGMREYTPNGTDRDDNLVEDMQAIINELVRINQELIKLRIATLPTTLKTFPTGLKSFAKAPILTENNHCRVGMCMRQLQQLYFSVSAPISPSFQDICRRLRFLDSFLVHSLWGENQLLKLQNGELLNEGQILKEFYKTLRILWIKTNIRT